MAAAHDGTADVSGAATAGMTLTITGKTTAGTNRVGAVSVSWNTSSQTVTGATWNGVAMTIVDQGVETVGASLGAALLTIVDPPTASSDIVVTFSLPATGNAVASSYNGVHQTTPIGASNKVITAGAVASPTSNTVTTAADEVLVDAVSWTQFDSVAPTVGANQTSLQNTLYAAFYFSLASRQNGADGGVMTWTHPGSGHYVSIAASLKSSDVTVVVVPRDKSQVKRARSRRIQPERETTLSWFDLSVVFPEAAGGGTTYTFTVSGGIIFSGSQTAARGRQINPSGNIVFSGTLVQQRGRQMNPTGGIVFSGTVTQQRGRQINPTGTLLFSGTAPFTTGGSNTYTFTPSGGIVFSGTTLINKQRVFSISGGIVYSGTVIRQFGRVLQPIGGIAFSGVTTFNKDKIYIPIGGIVYSGTSPFTFTPGGGGGGVTTRLPLTGAGN